jgi:hypothetical protein
MDEFDGRIDRIATDDFLVGMIFLPPCGQIEWRVLKRLAVPRNQILDSCH